ncbi:FixH family protein [Microbaculum marinum]|uniref:FixH family protein n=1 Tax=Microbaculum marinum TaxID=1764581 RepID=A0AAW9RL86_9HYPH
MHNDTGFRITGRTVLLGLVGFFGLIFAANAVLIWLAVSSHTGTVVGSSYKAGGQYQGEIDAARAQAARHWTVGADLVRSGPGATINVRVRDAAGAPVSGLSMAARLASPADETADVVVTLIEGEVGRYRGIAERIAPGRWMLIIDADRSGDRVYHSESRITLR